MVGNFADVTTAEQVYFIDMIDKYLILQIPIFTSNKQLNLQAVILISYLKRQCIYYFIISLAHGL